MHFFEQVGNTHFEDYRVELSSSLPLSSDAGCGAICSPEGHDAQRLEALQHLLLTGRQSEGRRLWSCHWHLLPLPPELLPW